MTPRGFFLLAAVYVMTAIMGWCLIAVLAAVWLPAS